MTVSVSQVEVKGQKKRDLPESGYMNMNFGSDDKRISFLHFILLVGEIQMGKLLWIRPTHFTSDSKGHENIFKYMHTHKFLVTLPNKQLADSCFHFLYNNSRKYKLHHLLKNSNI